MDSNIDSVNDEGSHLSTFGSRIKEERLKKGLSQNEFAKLAGVHRQTQINYEQGGRKPDTDYLQAISDIGVDVEYVLTGKSQRGVAGAYRAILEEIWIELGVYKGLQADWNSAYQQVLKDRDVPALTLSGRAGLDAVLALVHKSPFVLKGPSELIDLIERVEFVAETGGAKISASQRARAVFQLFQQKKAEGLDYVDLEMVKAAIDQAA